LIFSAISWAAIYFIVWWITLFAVLPFGVRNQVDDDEVAPGTEAGAPVRAPVLRVVLITTAVATAIFAVIYVLLTQDAFGINDIPFLPKFEPVR
jgi:predicted secreted protein